MTSFLHQSLLLLTSDLCLSDVCCWNLTCGKESQPLSASVHLLPLFYVQPLCRPLSAVLLMPGNQWVQNPRRACSSRSLQSSCGVATISVAGVAVTLTVCSSVGDRLARSFARHLGNVLLQPALVMGSPLLSGNHPFPSQVRVCQLWVPSVLCFLGSTLYLPFCETSILVLFSSSFMFR